MPPADTPPTAGTSPGAVVAPDEWTIPALLAARRRHDGAVQAFVSDDEAVTFAELDDASRALAARLVGAGVSKGSRLGLAMPNGIEWATLALAAMRVGAVLVPLSTLLRPPELLAQLRAAAVSHLVVVPELRGRDYLDELESVAPGLAGAARHGRGHAAAPSLRRIWLSDELPDEPAPAPVVDGLERVVRPADDLVVLFTSGSRGAPKGVVHTHGGGLRAVASSLESRRIGRGERLYIPMPFFWTGGFGGGLLSALVAGATLLTEAVPEPARTLRFLERERVTLFRGWPDQAARLAAHPDFAATDLSALRPASLPAVLPAALRPAPGARANLFGMTETFGPYCGSPLDTDLPAGKRGSCGRPFDGVEVRVVDPDTGAALPPGAEGEIRLRGPNVMRGIDGRQRGEVFDADGFYPTADRGMLDADGYLWYRGRLDDMFKVSGATVYPMEVEAALRALPGVTDAYVTDLPAGAAARPAGTPTPGETTATGGTGAAQGAGEVTRAVAAVVVAGSLDDPDQLAEQARARLSSFKVPTRWLVLRDPHRVPRLASGKVDVNALRRLLVEEGVVSSRKARPV
ncbi:acyl--CoA ligase [Frankia sp. CNm7]|uniref:Acyl--CoA ligase n=1 Tax=Frankia nepalensis TaxID=1836974 RepID=A0A937R720_9ACTN|nr:class I adenylate-forming enzyme family protein [Frankia nepalensis]MBL7497192.1 acyl--CoA ligase [Frankia nepalensis]MBL7515090.1 acyl--CoA ligase [Frankia nepalensis]MBL7522295.1 acyl--CoA ligase [Frankia nepalensis]MBL7626898.1 acyl--CoA ligase [Frankia nepalensis]